MNRPFLFLAGEYAVSMPAVFSRDRWQHSMISRPLVWRREAFNVDDPDTWPRGGTLARDNRHDEHLLGVVHYASVESELVRRANLEMIIRTGIPCWPDPRRLLELDDRHDVMRICVEAGLVSHPVQFVRHGDPIWLPRPFVLKTGNEHRGDGKHLIDDELPAWDDIATAEPFFHGTSARVLILEDRAFALRFDNPTTWIKNAAGAEVEPWPDIPQAAVEHAWRVHRHFGLHVSGIDYVIEKDGTPRFLEFNQFPGVGVTEEIAACARALFDRKMAWVEQLADASIREHVAHAE